MADDTLSEGDHSSSMSWGVVTGPETKSVGSMVDISSLKIASDTARSVADDISSIQMGDSHSVASSIDVGGHQNTTSEEAEVPPPPAPTDLELIIIGSDSATLTWKYSNPTKADTFTIERGENETNFVEVGSIGARREFFNDEDGLEEESTYYYRVRAKKESLVSEPSNVVKVTTLAELKPIKVIPEPKPPTNVTAKNGVEFSEVVIEWGPPSNGLADVKQFHVIRSNDGIDWDKVGTTGYEEIKFTDTVDWEASAEYYYWVAAVNIDPDDPTFERYSPIVWIADVKKPTSTQQQQESESS